jgi:fibronectin-binding autotransporter adhesin
MKDKHKHMKLLSIRAKRLVGTFAFIVTIIAAQFSGVQFASAASLTWTGTTNNNFSTATNWSTSAVPVTGDVVTFPAGIATATLNNDLVGVNLGGVVIAGTSNSASTTYTINTFSFATGATIVSQGTDTKLVVSGAVTSAGSLSVTTAGAATTFGSTVNTVGDLTVAGTNLFFTGAVTVGGNGTFTGASSQTGTYINLSNVLNVTGNLSLLGQNYGSGGTVTVGGNLVVNTSLYSSHIYKITGTTSIGDSASYNYSTLIVSTGSTFTGLVSVNDGQFSQDKGSTITVGSMAVKNGANVTLDGTAAFPITFGSGANAASPSLVLNNMETYSPTVYDDLKLTGAVTLLNDLSVNIKGNATGGSVSISGAVTTNGFSITKAAGSSGKLTVGGTEIQNVAATNTYNGNQPTASQSIYENETGILNGTRGNITVYTGGLLKGTGTITNQLYVYYGGMVNPGNSPGMLTILQSLYFAGGSTYQAELLNNTSYDQLQVGAQLPAGGGSAVTLGYQADLPTLQVILYPGWVINKGDTFKIIDNKATGPVVGTFAGLPEGTQLTYSGVVFSISYIGGDGNDVVLTALTAGAGAKVTAAGATVKAPNTGLGILKLANPMVLAGMGLVTATVLFVIARRKFNQ